MVSEITNHPEPPRVEALSAGHRGRTWLLNPSLCIDQLSPCSQQDLSAQTGDTSPAEREAEQTINSKMKVCQSSYR